MVERVIARPGKRVGKESAPMALGDQIGEASGTITGTRVIKSIGTQAQIEVSFQGSGTMLGQDITDIGTYWQTLRAGACSTAKGTYSI